MQMGAEGAKTEATGYVGGSNTEGENVTLEKCDTTLGTLALVEDIEAPWYRILSEQFKLDSTVPILKLLAQQSNCFVIVERGYAMSNVMQERALTQAGELRKDANFGKGQIVAADFTLNPTLIFSDKDTGKTAAGIMGAFGFWGQIAAGLAASARTKEAGTLLTLIDNRSGVQLAVAEGSASNTDFGVLSAIFGGSGGGAMGAYANTAEGKVIVAALTDAFNGIVRAARDYKAQTVEGGLGTGQGKMQVQNEATGKTSSKSTSQTVSKSSSGKAPAAAASKATSKTSSGSSSAKSASKTAPKDSSKAPSADALPNKTK
ncbi:MAG: CsgG/HfaB family protein [Burkholderiales bacterium]|nr:CsgG/HfaB family protein [Burkholderiales bacterium]